MISKELSNWLQVIGLFGVIGSLIFVGLQLRLERQVALTEGIGAALQADISFVELMAQYSDVWLKGTSGESLSSSERHQFDELARVNEFRYFSNWNRVNQLGTSNADRWVKAAALDFFDNPGLRAWWNQYLSRLDRLGDDGGEWVAQIETELGRLEQEFGGK